MMHKKVLEAAIFISSTPMTLDQLARVTGINSLGHVKELMENLQKEYEERGLELVNTPEGWVMQVRQELLPSVAHLTPYSDLAEGPKRTLALVTLKEPVKQSEIIKMQGNKAYSYIKDLVKRGLITSEKEGHTKILKLTLEFERYFGEEKSKVKEQLQKHLELSAKEGEPVYEEAEEEPEFLEKKPAKEKAKVSVKKVKAEDEEEEPESEEKEEKVSASHDHAFKEIE
jgi:segregation and condensation protein B